jgi:acyl-CoA dehydrogenase
MVLSAASEIDSHGAKKAAKSIAIAKCVVPSMTQRVIDRAIQACGARGVSQDTVLARMYAFNRTLRIADGY